jgi:hypothetical protein
MKKLFFALMLTGLISGATINTVSAMSHAKVVSKNGQEDDKKKKDKCSKDKACCKAKGTASADGKKCSQAAASKDSKSETETKTQVKKAEEKKQD